ncbi:MAG TPA: M23 family metallopeptidase [Candidatus Limnocylindria bacterium]|jgi:murein DD-endopeptidase MepM/ murein hydrolase activator NlpD
MRPLIGILCVVLFGAIAVLATAGRSGALAVPAPAPTAAPAPSMSPSPRPSPTPSPLLDPEMLPTHVRLLRGFHYPVAGTDIPAGESYLPNSPREYRAGYHEGIDFPAPAGTPVLAAKDGHIVRIDHNFTDWSALERNGTLADAQALGYTPEQTLDRIRGRQVWIDHGDGIVTRYAHLESVGRMQVGSFVEAGTVIGAVGSSGLPEGGPHLHFEIRIGDGFYGDGLPGPQLRYALAAAFR